MIARALILLVLAAGPAFQQEAADPVATFAAALSGKDTRAGWEAAERLLQLPAGRRGDIESALDKLPAEGAFLARVVRDELAAREKLGARYGTVKPVTVEHEQVKALEIVNDLVAKSGLKVDTTQSLSRNPGEPMNLRLASVPPLAVLREVCVAAKVYPYAPLGQNSFHLYQGTYDLEGGTVFRNFLVYAMSTHVQRIVDFSGSPRRGITVSLQALTDGGIEIADFRSEAVLVEAVDDDGRPMKAADPAFLEAQSAASTPANRTRWYGWRQPQLHLDWASEKATKIAFLRGYLVAILPVESTTISIPRLNDGPASAANDLVEVKAEATSDRWGNTTVRLRVLPRKVKLAELAEMPLQVRLKLPSGAERPCSARSFEEDGELRIEGNPIYTGQDWREMRGQSPTEATLVLHTQCVERKVWFEIQNVPAR